MSNLQILQKSLSSEGIRTQFRNALAEGAQSFAASLAELYANDGSLRECDPNLVILEAMKAASLQLPISKGLGFAYLVPYRDKNRNGAKVPQLQIGYKGYLQLAQRTGRYRIINADVVYEGELRGRNKLTGEIDLSGEATSDKVIGYFAHIETIDGFTKTLYWTTEKMTEHKERYAKSASGPWKTHYHEMAQKTMLRQILTKYGTLTTEMMKALESDAAADERTEQEKAEDKATSAARKVIDVTPPKAAENKTNTTAEQQNPVKETLREPAGEPEINPGF